MQSPVAAGERISKRLQFLHFGDDGTFEQELSEFPIICSKITQQNTQLEHK